MHLPNPRPRMLVPSALSSCADRTKRCFASRHSVLGCPRGSAPHSLRSSPQFAPPNWLARRASLNPRTNFRRAVLASLFRFAGANRRDERGLRFTALVGEDSAGDRIPMVEAHVLADGVKRGASSTLRIVAPVHDPSYARVDDRARTHDTSFERYVKSGLFESPRAHFFCCIANGYDFCVSRWIIGRFTKIVSRRKKKAFRGNDDASDGDFTL